MQAVRKIANRLGLTGFYGPLYELFEVDDIYAPSVEVVAGGSLFHVVVDTDETATRILDALNKDRAGRVTFMPLNRLHPRETSYPQGNEVIPMISKLQYETRFQKAFMQVGLCGPCLLGLSIDMMTFRYSEKRSFVQT